MRVRKKGGAYSSSARRPRGVDRSAAALSISGNQNERQGAGQPATRCASRRQQTKHTVPLSLLERGQRALMPGVRQASNLPQPHLKEQPLSHVQVPRSRSPSRHHSPRICRRPARVCGQYAQDPDAAGCRAQAAPTTAQSPSPAHRASLRADASSQAPAQAQYPATAAPHSALVRAQPRKGSPAKPSLNPEMPSDTSRFRGHFLWRGVCL